MQCQVLKMEKISLNNKSRLFARLLLVNIIYIVTMLSYNFWEYNKSYILSDLVCNLQNSHSAVIYITYFT
jgi:hypothetical protein